MTDMYLRRNGSILYPASINDRDLLMHLPPDVSLRATVRVPRKPGYHRYYWALVGLIHKNLPDSVHMSREALHDLIKIGAGEFTPVRLPNGDVVKLPGSIAWGKMDEPAFRAFMDRAFHFLASDLIPGMDCEALEQEFWSSV